MSPLRQARKAKSLTLVECARLARTTHSTLSKLERGDQGCSIGLAARLSVALKISPMKILYPNGVEAALDSD